MNSEVNCQTDKISYEKPTAVDLGPAAPLIGASCVRGSEVSSGMCEPQGNSAGGGCSFVGNSALGCSTGNTAGGIGCGAGNSVL